MHRGKGREREEMRIHQLFIRGKIEHPEFLEMVKNQLASVCLHLVFNSVLDNPHLKISSFSAVCFSNNIHIRFDV